jgi:hypothetical protein
MILRLRVRPTFQGPIGRPRRINMSALQRVQQAAQASNVHTVEELKRWSVGDQELPSMIPLQRASVPGEQS